MTDEQQNQAADEQDYADPWKPEKGDTITGTVVSVNLSPDFGYGPYPIVTLNTPDGERAVHAYRQVLRTELAKRRPKHGDQLEITYLGTRAPKSGKGNDFHLYRVQGGAEPEFNWDAELPPEQRQGGSAGVPIQPNPIPPAPPAPPTAVAQRAPDIAENLPNVDYDPNEPLPF